MIKKGKILKAIREDRIWGPDYIGTIVIVLKKDKRVVDNRWYSILYSKHVIHRRDFIIDYEEVYI